MAKEKKNWIQGAVNPKHKGYCTPMSKPTCTPRRKALAKRFKAMAKHETGGPIEYAQNGKKLSFTQPIGAFGQPNSSAIIFNKTGKSYEDSPTLAERINKNDTVYSYYPNGYHENIRMQHPDVVYNIDKNNSGYKNIRSIFYNNLNKMNNMYQSPKEIPDIIGDPDQFDFINKKVQQSKHLIQTHQKGKVLHATVHYGGSDNSVGASKYTDWAGIMSKKIKPEEFLEMDNSVYNPDTKKYIKEIVQFNPKGIDLKGEFNANNTYANDTGYVVGNDPEGYLKASWSSRDSIYDRSNLNKFRELQREFYKQLKQSEPLNSFYRGNDPNRDIQEEKRKQLNLSYKQGGRLSKDYISEAKEKAGGSNVGNKTFANGQPRTGPYVGPSGGAPRGSYPIPDLKHAKAALSLAHNAPDPEGIKRAVYNKFPELKK